MTLIAAGLLMSLGTANAGNVTTRRGKSNRPGLPLRRGFFPGLFGVPNLDGVSTIGGPCVYAGAWCFLNSEGNGSVSVTTDEFTYLISSVSVDEPPILSLLILGLVRRVPI